MKKTVSVLLVLISIITLFSACSEEPAAEKTAAEVFGLDLTKPVTLTIVGGLDNFEGLEAVIAKFETQYTNCKISYETIDAYGDNIAARLNNEAATTSMFLSSYSDFSGENNLVATTYNLSAAESGIDLSDTNRTVTNSQKIEGELFTLPVAMSPRGLIINKTLLAAHNIAVPKNYAELLDACEAFKQAGITPIHAQAKYLGLGLVYPYFADTVIHGENHDKVFSELNDFTAGSGEYLRDICERLEVFADKGYFEFDRTKDFDDNYDSAILNFFEGDVPFFPCSAETVSGMKKREAKSAAFAVSPFEYEFICTPIGDNGGSCYWQIWQGLSINKNSDNLEWSRAFVDFLAQEENLYLLASTKGMPSNTETSLDDARYASLYSVDPAHVVQASEFKITYYSLLNKTLQRITLPQNDPDRLDADGAIEYYEELIAEKRDK